MTDISFHASYPTLLYILNPCSISYNSYSCQPTRSLLWPTRPTGTYWLGLERFTFVPLDPSWIGTLWKCYVHSRIRNGLSGAALKFYEREFSFFKKVTSISGIIRWGGFNTSTSQAWSLLRMLATANLHNPDEVIWTVYDCSWFVNVFEHVLYHLWNWCWHG